MPLTFKQFRDIVAPYSGRAGECASAESVAVFSRTVMKYMLYSGSCAGELKLSLQARNGCISLPPEVETPIKARIDDRSAQVWDKWFSFHSSNPTWAATCLPIGDVLIEEGRTPLAYALPVAGTQLGVMSTCTERSDSEVIIQGKDVTGKEIYSAFKGEQVVGERLGITRHQIKYGQIKFGQVTGVSKPITAGYVSLWAVNPLTEYRTLLAEWAPSETTPMYMRMRVRSQCGPCVNLSMLCRVKLKDSYHDNELTYFDDPLAVTIAAQRIQAEVNQDLQTAQYKKIALDDILNQEAGYKKQSNNPVDVYFPLSGGAVKNIIR